MHIVWQEVGDTIKQAGVAIPARAGKAAVRAMHATSAELKKLARADIARAGMKVGMQNALRFNVYPNSPTVASFEPALYITHNVHFAKIFEEGGTILGKPFMWLALPSIPRKIGVRRMTPRLFTQTIGKLVSMRGGSKPLLGARITISGAKLKSGKRFTVSQLKRGAQKAGVGAGLGIIRVVPAFVGIPSVTVKKRFNLRGIFETASTVFLKHFSRLLG